VPIFKLKPVIAYEVEITRVTGGDIATTKITTHDTAEAVRTGIKACAEGATNAIVYRLDNGKRHLGFICMATLFQPKDSQAQS
jgi:hypothetical protein